MNTNEYDNPLIECPICKKRVKGRSLAVHMKNLHANTNISILKKCNTEIPTIDGIKIKSHDLIRELNGYVIDENGFLVSLDSVIEQITENNSEKAFHPEQNPRPKKQSNVFSQIKSTGKKIPGARIKKIRPLPGEEVICPLCDEVFFYMYLFNHVTFAHKEENAKLVLAEFNKKYEKAEMISSSKRKPYRSIKR